MTKETEAQSQKVIVASDMTCTITFSGDRQYTSQDLQNLIAQLDMQRALMDGENFNARAHITTGAPAERRHVAAKARAVKDAPPVLPAKTEAKPDDGLSIPGPRKERWGVGRKMISDAVTAVYPKAAAVTPPTPEEIAREVDEMETARQSGYAR